MHIVWEHCVKLSIKSIMVLAFSFMHQCNPWSYNVDPIAGSTEVHLCSEKKYGVLHIACMSNDELI